MILSGIFLSLVCLRLIGDKKMDGEIKKVEKVFKDGEFQGVEVTYEHPERGEKKQFFHGEEWLRRGFEKPLFIEYLEDKEYVAPDEHVDKKKVRDEQFEGYTLH